MDDLKISTLIKEESLKNRVAELGAELTDKYKGKELVAICVLKGSLLFFADLIRSVKTDLVCEFLGVSSYGALTHSSGEVKVTLDLTHPVENRHVILVEDIVDTGLTMSYLQKLLLSRKPKSLTTVSLLLKPDALKVDCKLDHVGFKIPNDFVVGYGLDYQDRFRNLPYIGQVTNLN